MTRKDILSAADRCVNGERDQQYGSPATCFSIIADFWNTYISRIGNRTLKPDDVAAMMALMKLARIANGSNKDDNWIDLAGYAACGGELQSPQDMAINGPSVALFHEDGVQVKVNGRIFNME